MGGSVKNQGFTLLELIVVLVLLSLGTTLAIFALSKAEKKQRIRFTTKQVVLLLKEARAKAIMRQGAITLKRAEKGMDILVTSPSIGIIERYTPPEGITIDMDAIVFFPTGASSGGMIEISDQKRHYRIKVDEATGITTVVRQ